MERVSRAIQGQQRGKKTSAWLFCLPAILFNLVWGWYPLSLAFRIVFYRWSIFRPPSFIGWTNFQIVFDDPILITSIANTFYYVVLSIGLTFFIPIIAAIMLMEMKPKTIRVIMILWFIPIASMASILLWKYFYNPNWGLLNGILQTLGLPTSRWLESPRMAMFCIILPGIIMYGPGLIYIASLQTTPQEFYEAADLEGAGFWRKIWSITLPRLRPVIAVMLILAIIGGMQVFDSIYILTAGGPGYATTTLIMRLFKMAFHNMNFGRGGVYALLLFFIIMSLVIIQRKYFKEDIDR